METRQEIKDLIDDLRALGAEVRVVRNEREGGGLGKPWLAADWDCVSTGIEAERIRTELTRLSARREGHVTNRWLERRGYFGTSYDLGWSWWPEHGSEAIRVLTDLVDHTTPRYVAAT